MSPTSEKYTVKGGSVGYFQIKIKISYSKENKVVGAAILS